VSASVFGEVSVHDVGDTALQCSKRFFSALAFGDFAVVVDAAGAGVETKPDAPGTEEGLRWLAKAADLGLPEAAVSYGSMLYFGDHGLPRDPAKAAPYLRVAANHGNPSAQNMLGTMYQSGTGVAQDTAAAEQWYRKAALQGDGKAQSNLGQLLNPLDKDRDRRIEALAWLLIAQAQNEVTAQKSLDESFNGVAKADLDSARTKADELAKRIRKR